MDDETKADLGKALADALKAGDGMGVYDAFEALSRACGGMEPDEDDMSEESGEKAPSALVLALGKKK